MKAAAALLLPCVEEPAFFNTTYTAAEKTIFFTCVRESPWLLKFRQPARNNTTT